MASRTNVNSFFKTKLAQAKAPKKKEEPPEKDPLIDPGEAAAAGLAFAAGPVAQKVFPLVGGWALGQMGPTPKLWTSDVAQDVKFIRGGMLDPLPKPRKIMGLFDAMPRPVEGPGTFTRHVEDVEQLKKIQKTVNLMLGKYGLPSKGVRMELTPGSLSRLTGPRYETLKKKIVLPDIEEAGVLHEIGHAAHLTKPGATTLNFARKLLHKGTHLAVPMAYIAGDEIKKMFPGKIDDKVIDFIQQHAPGIVASTYAASELYPEVQATTRAVKHVYDVKGAKAARETLKALLPPMASYALPLIPTMVGIGLARKWYMEAKEKEADIEKMFPKEAGVASDIWKHIVSPLGKDVSWLGGQLTHGAHELFHQPLSTVGKRLWKAGKHVAGSSDFATGAAMAGIPALTFGMINAATPHGKAYTRRLEKIPYLDKETVKARKESEKNPFIIPAIMGITAAISGGLLSKFYGDIYKVM